MTIDEVRVRLIARLFKNIGNEEALKQVDGEIAILDKFMEHNFGAKWNIGELRYDLYQ